VKKSNAEEEMNWRGEETKKKIKDKLCANGEHKKMPCY
jgi:hypothetical protein